MPSIKYDFLFSRKLGHANEVLNTSVVSHHTSIGSGLICDRSKGEFSILLPFSFEYAQDFLLRKRKSFWAQTLN